MKISILFIAFFFTANIALASGELIKSSLFENYTVSNGLTDEKIHCVFQDSKGWIWIGTDYGVFKFDGYTFNSLPLNSEESEVLANSLIRKIYEDKQGYIWIGTDFEGLFRYDRFNNQLIQIKNRGFSHNSIWDIVLDKNNMLFLGTEGGLTYFNPETLEVEKVFTTSNSNVLNGNWIRKLFIDSENQLWVGTNAGISIINQKHELVDNYLNNAPASDRENEIWEIYKDSEDNFWVGTYLGGLFKIDHRSKHTIKIELDDSNNRTKTVRSIIQDNKGDLWFGTRGGLYVMDRLTNNLKGYHKETNNKFSLIHNSVLDLTIDKKGDLWVATRNGLSFLNFDKQAFGYIAHATDDKTKLNNSEVYVIWESSQGELWIGTENGGINIVNKDRNRIRTLTTSNGLSTNCIKAVSPDGTGNILIGTYLGGLNVYNPKSGEVIVLKNNPDDKTTISGNEVWAVATSSNGEIWVGTSSGLDKYDPHTQTFERYGEKYGVKAASMIFEDSRRYLWTYSSDLDLLTLIKNDNRKKEFKISSRAICEDIDGNLWMATLGQGLLKADGEGNVLESFTTKDGLSSNILNGIINVNNNYLWISTNNGISRFSFESKEFRNYYNSDGLLNNKYNYGAFYKTSNNTLVFGGNRGVDFVFLDKINKNNYIPPIVITGLRIFNKRVTPNDGKGILNKHISETELITLKHNQNMISFDFAALNYANSPNNKYKYKLQGFDNEWNDIGNLRIATYTNLDHGEYVFKVIGSNNDNVFNEKGAQLGVNILPPVWKTWWFKSLMLLTILLLFYLLFLMIRNREKLKQELIFERQTARKIQELDRHKHQFFMNISHEIRTPLSLIVGPIDKLLKHNIDDRVVLTNLQIIKRNATNLKKMVNQLLDYRRIETGNIKLELGKGNLNAFMEGIVNSFEHTAEVNNISLNFKSFQKSVFTWFDADKVEKILNNLISNAIKYSNNNGHVVVSLSMSLTDDIDNPHLLIPPLDLEHSNFNKYLKIKVADTGIGIPESDLPKIFDRFRRIENLTQKNVQGTGIGLALTKEMVKLHKGHLKVKSKLGKGSQFVVYLPFYEQMQQENAMAEQNQANEEQTDEEYLSQNNTRLIALVADDNTDLRMFIKSHFTPEYHVVEAKNGKEGWEKSLVNIPDIVIADVMMPEMDGNELCKKLKQDERTSHIPVIMLSALGSSEHQIAGIDSGADDYLTKPFDIGLLKAKVDNILSIRKALRERFSKEMVLKPKDIILNSPDEKFLKRLINLIERNIAKETLDVEFMAANLDVSRTQLYRKIGALTDMSPKEFVKDFRFKRAAQLLTQNKLNISEVSYKVGFNDVSYFRKCFKDKYGMSASEYRNKHSEK